ncbi:uncharacterized protein LOC108737843 isoform X3 [Agrilus planipennis]|uniref:Uncharacterized protein LOC108737843 isoform X3 n=1 Tax=Agrilus planipennis TaxID=224129 RepID=A0A1W4WRD7_AGRPL|nr:uncharacterized protein LOC108737843 isoform X3 [Agrilus planipennis]
MIGAMPAVAVRHERQKGQDKRHKRPSHIYIGGHWVRPISPSATPSPNGPNYQDNFDDRLPEYYVCGKISTLQIVVGSLLLGAIVLVVGLVQLTPNAADADHRYFFLGTGSALLLLGLIMTGVRCCCMHCPDSGVEVEEEDRPPELEAVNSIDVLVQRRDTQEKGLEYVLLALGDDRPRYFN